MNKYPASIDINNNREIDSLCFSIITPGTTINKETVDTITQAAIDKPVYSLSLLAKPSKTHGI
jgi:hypothetical protein